MVHTMPFDISLPEMFIILIAVLLIFGPKRLPEMGRSLGKGLRQFRESVTGMDELVSTTAPTSSTASTQPETASEPAPATTDEPDSAR